MADGFSIDIKGLAEVKAKLESLGTTEAKKCVRKALKAGATITQSAVEERAPRRPDVPAGTALPPGGLRGDIIIKMKESDQGNQVAVVQPGELTWHVAQWVENGHRLVHGKGKKGTATGTSVKARPFVVPAYEETREQVADVIATTLVTEIDKVSK